MGISIHDKTPGPLQEQKLGQAKVTGGVKQIAGDKPGMGEQFASQLGQRAINKQVDPLVNKAFTKKFWSEGAAALAPEAAAVNALPLAQQAGVSSLAGAGLSPGAAMAITGSPALAGTTASTAALGTAGAGLGTAALAAAPWLAGGYLGGKALGVFNKGGPVGYNLGGPIAGGEMNNMAMPTAGGGQQGSGLYPIADSIEGQAGSIRQVANDITGAVGSPSSGGKGGGSGSVTPQPEVAQAFNTGGSVRHKAGDWMGKKVKFLVDGGAVESDAFQSAMKLARHYNNGGDVTPDMMMPDGTMDPMADDPNMGYVPTGGPTAKEQLDLDKVTIQRTKAEEDEKRKSQAFAKGESRKDQSHQQQMMNKQQVHTDRKGPLMGG